MWKFIFQEHMRIECDIRRSELTMTKGTYIELS